MVCHNMLQRIETPVRAALVGSGHYGTALLVQALRIPSLDLRIVCDVSHDRARLACRRAGIHDDRVVVCDSRASVLRALESGRHALLDDPAVLFGLPLDVLVECTGDAEAGARHALAAIEHGMHIAMVTKETDCVAGPILKRIADDAGVVYTAVDGDQHGLIMGLVGWLRAIGLDMVCAGKARDTECVFDPTHRTLTDGRRTLPLDVASAASFGPMPPGEAALAIARRRESAGGLDTPAAYDLAELTIAANATGLLPDAVGLHAPLLRVPEIPEALCPMEEGGVLSATGAIEAVTCLRGPNEAGMGGGVFAVAACDSEYSLEIMRTKGLITNRAGRSVLVYRPYHLCGVETAVSVLCAGALRTATGASDYLPAVDFVARASTGIAAGTTLSDEGDPRLSGLLLPAQPLADAAPLPFYLLLGRPLRVDVPAGTVITAGMVEPPAASALWDLRRRQDAVFFPKRP